MQPKAAPYQNGVHVQRPWPGQVVVGEDLSLYVCKDGPHPIGVGAFTDVYKGILQKPGSKPMAVAIKIFRAAHLSIESRDATNRRIKRESTIWCQLAHSYVQPYLGFCDNDKIGPSAALVSPFCKHGSILDHLVKYPNANRTKFVVQVAHGIQYIHIKDILHGDLSGKNVLIDDNGDARLTDFGRAKIIGHSGYTSDLFAGCVQYMAPELFPDEDMEDGGEESGSSRGPPFTKMSDIYAFSMLAFQLFTDCSPLQRGPKPLTCHSGQIINRIHKGHRPKRTLDLHNRIPNEIWGLMEDCWEANPTKRPTAGAVVESMRRWGYNP